MSPGWPASCGSANKSVQSGCPKREPASGRSRQRAVDHRNRVSDAIGSDEGTEARTFLLAEQHLIEHVEPVERHARFAVLGFDLADLVEKRLAAADLIDHLLDGFGHCLFRQLSVGSTRVQQSGTNAACSR